MAAIMKTDGSLHCGGSLTSRNTVVTAAHCFIDRSNGKSPIKSKIISQVELNIPTFSKQNLPKELSSLNPVKPGSRNL